MKKLLGILLASLMILAGCSSSTTDEGTTEGTETSNTDVKVGFVYVGPVGDEGYTYAHDLGRQEMEKTLGVETVYVENVPENADCEKAIRDLIDQGCNVIFTTSFGHMDWTAKVADDHPDVKFFHCSGYTTKENMTAYFGRMYQPRYLSGIVAGLNTENNKIGYVAATPIPEVVRGINAFTLGVRSVNPEATVEVVWTNTWYDPGLEKSAAMELLNKGCDLIAQHQDTTGPQIAAQEKGAKCIGYNSSTPTAAPDAYLTSPVWNFGPYYTKAVQSVMDGTYKSENYWGPMSDGIVKLDTLTDNCKEGTQEAVDEAMAKLAEDDFVFAGEIKDNEGNVRVEAGQKLTDEEMLALDWFVEGVIGSVAQ